MNSFQRVLAVQIELNFDKKHFRNKTIRGGGLPHERGGDARRLAWGYKFQVLVSLRVFWTKHHYI